MNANFPESERAAFLNAMRAMEISDDQCTCTVVSLDLEAALAHPAAGECADSRSDSGAGAATESGALADSGTQEGDSLTGIFENALLNPLFQRQAT